MWYTVPYEGDEYILIGTITNSNNMNDKEVIASTAEETTNPSIRSRQPEGAHCIQLSLFGRTFRPEFTHQLFPGETIRGYQPFAEANACTAENTANDVGDNMRELSIQVDLAPSCRKSHVTLQIRRTKKRRLQRRASSATGSRDAKRPRDTEEIELASYDEVASEEDLQDDSSYSENEEERVDDNDKNTNGAEHQEGKTRYKRMPRAEIQERLSLALPAVTISADEVCSDFLNKPLGCVLEEYMDKDGNSFCLTIAKGSDVVDYHDQLQRLALFFIETASNVNVADESQGFWRVLYLFRKHSSAADGIDQFSLAGYMTLYHFTAPFRRPRPGIVVRVCQALFLPIYQRAGHGQRMLTALHKWADGEFNTQIQNHGLLEDFIPKEVVEINVEDPAPAFTALRNRVDYQRFLATHARGKNWFDGFVAIDVAIGVDDEEFFALLKDAVAVNVASTAKVTTHQIQIVYEIYKLFQLRSHLKTSSASQEKTTGLEKRYRIMVKKRLQKENREELSACRTKEDMQALLGKRYDAAIEQYDRILAGGS